MKPRILKLPLFLWLPTSVICTTGVASAQNTATPATASTSGATRIIVQLDGAPSVQLGFWPSPLQMHATVSGSIAQMSVGTQMRVAPQAVNPLSAKMSLTAANVSPVQVILTVPELARTSKLDYASVKINGQPIALAGKWESDPRIGPRCVHLFFDRSKIVAILGPSASQQVVTLQIAFGGGHLLVASDIIKLW